MTKRVLNREQIDKVETYLCEWGMLKGSFGCPSLGYAAVDFDRVPSDDFQRSSVLLPGFYDKIETFVSELHGHDAQAHKLVLWLWVDGNGWVADEVGMRIKKQKERFGGLGCSKDTYRKWEQSGYGFLWDRFVEAGLVRERRVA